MEPISFLCPACQQPLKFSAERAGKKAKCTRCGKDVEIPAAASPPPPPPADDEDDDGGKHYGIITTSEEEQKKRLPPSKRKKDKAKAKIKKRRKTIPDVDAWGVVRHGLLLMSIGSMIWGGLFAFRTVLVLLGCAKGPEFNPVRVWVLVRDDALPDPGNMGNLDLVGFWIGLVSGSDFATFTVAMNILIAFGTLVQIAFFLMGYFTCLTVPERFGMRGQVLTMIVLSVVNLLAMIVVRLLPLLGVFSYTINYFLVPELPLLESNIERMTPIHVFWASAPFWEMVVNIFLLGCLYLEYTMGAVFLRCVNMAIKDELLTDSSMGLIELGLGTMFALLSYYLASLCGTSDVMISVCRLIYLLWSGFIALYIVRYTLLLNKTRAVIDSLVKGTSDDQAEDEEAEEQEDKKKKKPAREEEEEDTEEDDERDEDDEEDDDDDDDRPPKRKKKR